MDREKRQLIREVNNLREELHEETQVNELMIVEFLEHKMTPELLYQLQQQEVHISRETIRALRHELDRVNESLNREEQRADDRDRQLYKAQCDLQRTVIKYEKLMLERLTEMENEK